MELKNFVKIYDNILPLESVSSLIRYANSQSFKKTNVAGADGEAVDFNVRRTYSLPLFQNSSSLTNVHWHNLLHSRFTNFINSYVKDCSILDFPLVQINNIEILKYENTGFYGWHVDHFSRIPRTMSCIYLLNNDYEGGNLCFKNPDGSGEWEVSVKANRMIVWPSIFLFPHTVKPVTKGTRFSVVAWAL